MFTAYAQFLMLCAHHHGFFVSRCLSSTTQSTLRSSTQPTKNGTAVSSHVCPRSALLDSRATFRSETVHVDLMKGRHTERRSIPTAGGVPPRPAPCRVQYSPSLFARARPPCNNTAQAFQRSENCMHDTTLLRARRRVENTVRYLAGTSSCRSTPAVAVPPAAGTTLSRHKNEEQRGRGRGQGQGHGSRQRSTGFVCFGRPRVW